MDKNNASKFKSIKNKYYGGSNQLPQYRPEFLYRTRSQLMNPTQTGMRETPPPRYNNQRFRYRPPTIKTYSQLKRQQ